MKSLNAKLLLSALGIALLATPAFAQRPQRHVHQTESQNSPAAKSDAYNPQYVPGYGNVDTSGFNEW